MKNKFNPQKFQKLLVEDIQKQTGLKIDLMTFLTDADKLEASKKVLIPAESLMPLPTACPFCGHDLWSHGKRAINIQTWPTRAGQQVFFHIKRPHFVCSACGKSCYQPLPDTILENHRITKGFADSLCECIRAMPFKAAERLFCVQDSTLKNVFMESARGWLAQHQFVLPTVLGMDEVMIGGKFRTVLTNLEQRSLYDMLSDRKQDFLEEKFAAIPIDQREAVMWVCTDMYRPFKKPIGALLPNARWVIDRFHVVKMATQAVDQIRKVFQKGLPADTRRTFKKTIRWLLLCNSARLTEEDKQVLSVVRAACPALMEGYDLKEDFRQIWEAGTRSAAEERFLAWKDSIPKDAVFEDFRSLSHTFENFHEYILNYYDACALTNGYTEALNGLIKIVNRLGRGYEFETLRLKMLTNPRAVADSTRFGIEYGTNMQTLENELDVPPAPFDEDMLAFEKNKDADELKAYLSEP